MPHRQRTALSTLPLVSLSFSLPLWIWYLLIHRERTASLTISLTLPPPLTLSILCLSSPFSPPSPNVRRTTFAEVGRKQKNNIPFRGLPFSEWTAPSFPAQEQEPDPSKAQLHTKRENVSPQAVIINLDCDAGALMSLHYQARFSPALWQSGG